MNEADRWWCKHAKNRALLLRTLRHCVKSPGVLTTIKGSVSLGAERDRKLKTSKAFHSARVVLHPISFSDHWTMRDSIWIR